MMETTDALELDDLAPPLAAGLASDREHPQKGEMRAGAIVVVRVSGDDPLQMPRS